MMAHTLPRPRSRTKRAPQLGEGRRILLESIKEPQWQRQVIDWAHRAGYLVHHVHDSRHEEWGTDPGFPDLTLAKDGDVFFVELKTVRGRQDEHQLNWHSHIAPFPYYVWRPTDEPEVKRRLGLPV